ncbi:LysR family transcriptional regulator [Oceanospirillum beijerinckii]|uniref:LysR family transcriptional regulator n=1 Tax=Oceanospirillum beijerinckii TaxID=64976 RepID=UPI0003F715BB|nr:LysR family transcriptional regulator [Oceanospirillum beijerinckii]MAC48139.1 LysR family transcriptional regulator [Oceanospirillum sp.]
MQNKQFKGQLSDIDLRMLRIYRTVVECGGFSAAEVELNISRAAISIAMSDLERRLGFRLCQRGRSGFSMTEEGEKIYDYTLQLLSSIEDFKTQINTLHTQLIGELNIGITDNMVTIPQMRITRALSALKQRGPEVVINIRMMPPNEIESALLDGRLHVGVVPELRSLPGLNYFPLYEEQSLLYCSQKHPLFEHADQPISDEALADYDAVVPAYAQSVENKQQQSLLKASATSTDREGIAFLILSNHYIGFLPTHFAERWVTEGRIRAIQPKDRFFHTRFTTITRKGARPNLILEAYMEEIEKIDT